MRSLHTQHSKGHPTLLTTGKSADLLQTRQTSDSEGPKVRTVLLLRLAGELCLEEGDGRLRHVERVDVLLNRFKMVNRCRPDIDDRKDAAYMLRKVSDSKTTVPSHATLVGFKVTSQQLNPVSSRLVLTNQQVPTNCRYSQGRF